jgi:hypothetical protein
MRRNKTLPKKEKVAYTQEETAAHRVKIAKLMAAVEYASPGLYQGKDRQLEAVVNVVISYTELEAMVSDNLQLFMHNLVSLSKCGNSWFMGTPGNLVAASSSLRKQKLSVASVPFEVFKACAKGCTDFAELPFSVPGSPSGPLTQVKEKISKLPGDGWLQAYGIAVRQKAELVKAANPGLFTTTDLKDWFLEIFPAGIPGPKLAPFFGKLMVAEGDAPYKPFLGKLFTLKPWWNDAVAKACNMAIPPPPAATGTTTTTTSTESAVAKAAPPKYTFVKRS